MSEQHHPAPGGSPPALGRVAPSDPVAGSGRFTADGLARLSAAAKATLQSPEAVARRLAAQEAGRAWSDERKEQVRQWAAKAVSVREMGRRLGLSYDTVKSRAKQYGINLRGPALARYADAKAVLVAYYPTAMPLNELLALYRKAVGANVTADAMQTYARKLKLRRICDAGRMVGTASRQASAQAEREALAQPVQELLDRHTPLEQISVTLTVSTQRLQRMLAEGLVTRPAKPEKPKPEPKVRLAKPPPPPKPKALPKSWVRATPTPPKPKPVYESVEAWLAAGNRITVCPTVAVEATTARIPEADRAALTAVYAEREKHKVKGRNGAALRAASLTRGRAHGWLT